jgi:hypothetical protein
MVEKTPDTTGLSKEESDQKTYCAAHGTVGLNELNEEENDDTIKKQAQEREYLIRQSRKRKSTVFWVCFRIAFFIGLLAAIGGLIYGCWHAERWLNYKWGYSHDVAKDVEPLKKDIEELKKRMEKLEAKHGEEVPGKTQR